MPEVATRYVPQHFTPLFNRDIDVSFRVMHGGRGGGKSKTAALGIVHFIEWYEATTGKPCRVLCARETQKSITHSSKDAIESVIDELGRGAYYKILSNQIRTPRGGYILFHGISEQYRTDRSVKSLENINLVWFEEGEYMSARSRELLYPTVFRNPGSEIWVTFNPHFRTDPRLHGFHSARTTAGTCLDHARQFLGHAVGVAHSRAGSGASGHAEIRA